MASELGMSLLEGAIHHRSLFSPNRQTTEVCGLLDSSWRWAEAQPWAGAAGHHATLGCVSQQLGQHRSLSFPVWADAAPFWKGLGAHDWLLHRKFGERGADLKERKEWVCERVGSSLNLWCLKGERWWPNKIKGYYPILSNEDFWMSPGCVLQLSIWQEIWLNQLPFGSHFKHTSPSLCSDRLPGLGVGASGTGGNEKSAFLWSPLVAYAQLV